MLLYKPIRNTKHILTQLLCINALINFIVEFILAEFFLPLSYCKIKSAYYFYNHFAKIQGKHWENHIITFTSINRSRH